MNKQTHSKLWLYFTAIIFATILLVFAAITLMLFLLYRFHVIPVDLRAKHAPILFLLLGSLLLGTIIALFVGKLMIRPIQHMSDAFEELSKGNFTVKMATNEKIAEIQGMAKRFNAMTYHLAHMETLRSDFVANVSHEFKTPLAAIEGYATLLQNPNLTQEQHDHYVEIILENTKRLSTLSSNILTLSKLENQEILLDKRDFRLDEQIRRTILLLEPKWSCKHIEFDLDLPKQMYYGSEVLLAQVWSNILDNAIKHAPQQSMIHVNLQTNEKTLTISITDHGKGMSQEVQQHIFEKFYQEDHSRKTEGNGLGLALVKRIVELSDGTIQVKSVPEQGSTFLVQLPLSKNPL